MSLVPLPADYQPITVKLPTTSARDHEGRKTFDFTVDYIHLSSNLCNEST